MIRPNVTVTTLVLAFACVSLAASASDYRQPPRKSDQLPSIECNATGCRLDYAKANSEISSRSSALPVAPSTTPSAVAPPGGQRMEWQGAAYPACQSMIGAPYSISDKYVYIEADDVPVPLGSTHASLLSSMQSNLAGGSTGAGAIVAFLQAKRSNSATWSVVNATYAFTTAGNADPTSLYGTTAFTGLVDLAALPGGTTVPDNIDIQVAVFPLYTTGFTPAISAVCRGKLELTF